jgi:hypothetical protein
MSYLFFLCNGGSTFFYKHPYNFVTIKYVCTTVLHIRRNYPTLSNFHQLIHTQSWSRWSFSLIMLVPYHECFNFFSFPSFLVG